MQAQTRVSCDITILCTALTRKTECLFIHTVYGRTDSHVQEALRGLFPVFDEDS